MVVDHNPGLLERVRADLPDVIALENLGAPGASEARNTGVQRATGHLIAFLDDDAMADPDWLSSHYSGYERADVLGVGGEIEPVWPKGRPWWFPDEFDWVVGATYRGFPETTSAVRNVWTVNMSVRREIFDAIQGFRHGFGKVRNNSSPEDTDFCIRALQHQPGSIWLYKPEAKVRHRVHAERVKWKYYLWRCYLEGLGKARLSSYLGAKIGVSSERSYALKTLPKGILKGFTDALYRRDPSGLGRAAAILIGLATTMGGYVIGTFTEPFKK